MTIDTGAVAFQSAHQLRDAIVARTLSPVEIIEATLDLQRQLEPVLNCFVTCTAEIALEAAKQAEKSVLADEMLSPLHGLPISVKDNIPVAGVRFTSGSRALAGNIASADGAVVERIKTAGACIIGKTTMSEFGCKPVGDSPLTGVTRNPWNISKTPGGSSAGAAASVAAGLTPFAIGTDGGGSIRIPAAFCGLFGVKVQLGRVPAFPMAAVPNLFHIGAISRSVRDSALLLAVISGHDPRDVSSINAAIPDYLVACDAPIKGIRIAWSPTLGYAKPEREIVELTEQAARVFADLGAIVEQVDDVLELRSAGNLGK